MCDVLQWMFIVMKMTKCYEKKIYLYAETLMIMVKASNLTSGTVGSFQWFIY